MTTLLVAVKPAGQGNYDEVERLHGIFHCTNNLAVILFYNNTIRLVRILGPYGHRRDIRALVSSSPDLRFVMLASARQSMPPETQKLFIHI